MRGSLESLLFLMLNLKKKKTKEARSENENMYSLLYLGEAKPGKHLLVRIQGDQSTYTDGASVYCEFPSANTAILKSVFRFVFCCFHYLLIVQPHQCVIGHFLTIKAETSATQHIYLRI